jgi:hypothetical protein
MAHMLLMAKASNQWNHIACLARPENIVSMEISIMTIIAMKVSSAELVQLFQMIKTCSAQQVSIAD